MAATCALIAPPDLFRVCKQGPWVERPTELRFLVAGVVWYTVNFRAMLLRAPFTHVLDDGSELPPAPAEFPQGIEVARIFACPIQQHVRTVVLLPNAIRYVQGQSRHFYIDLAGSFPEYLQRFSSKSRGTLKRKVRRFCETAATAAPLRVFSRPAEMDEFHRLAVSVSAKTYQHRLLDAGLENTPAFRREGRVRGNVLLCGARPAAFSLCHLAGSTFTLGKIGYDPALAHMHPGTVLTYLVLERLFAERRFRLFDFAAGNFSYKEFFATGHVRCADILHLRRSCRNLAVVGAHYALDSVGLKHRRGCSAGGSTRWDSGWPSSAPTAPAKARSRAR